MKLFLSWSGRRSHSVAEALRDWLPMIINSVEPFISSDIEKGSTGMVEIGRQLDDCSFGIVLVTPGNKLKPWINFEAGALAKSVNNNPARTATVLVGMANPNEVTGPLSQFQHTVLSEKDDMRKLVRAVDAHADKPRPVAQVDKVFDLMWDSFWTPLEGKLALEPGKSPVRGRTSDDKIDELLAIVRGLQRNAVQSDSQELSSETVSEDDHMIFQALARNVVAGLLGEEAAIDTYTRLDSPTTGLVRVSGLIEERTRTLLRAQLRRKTGVSRLQLAVDD